MSDTSSITGFGAQMCVYV